MRDLATGEAKSPIPPAGRRSAACSTHAFLLPQSSDNLQDSGPKKGFALGGAAGKGPLMPDPGRNLPDGTYIVLVRSLYATLLPTIIITFSFIGVGMLIAIQTPDR